MYDNLRRIELKIKEEHDSINWWYHCSVFHKTIEVIIRVVLSDDDREEGVKE